jgi:hypothetical protein
MAAPNLERAGLTQAQVTNRVLRISGHPAVTDTAVAHHLGISIVRTKVKALVRVSGAANFINNN